MFPQVVQRVKRVIYPVVSLSLVVFEINSSNFLVCAHFLNLIYGTPVVFVEHIMKEIRPVNAQILLLQL